MVDSANWLRKMLLTPITIASFTPMWDAGNRMTQEVIVLPGQNQTRTYTYDDEDQLLTASILNRSEAYTYDERHNRLTKRIQAGGSDTTDYYTMNIGDQLTERVKKHTQSQVVIEEEEYTYSDNGHMTSRVLTTGGNDFTTSYQYDVGGNLKQVTLPDSATVTYQYDAYGNRVKKQTSTEKVSYEYAGGSCQREIHRNPSDTILYALRYYPWGFTKTVPGTPDVTTSYYYLVDTRGWVWGLTDADGVIIETYQYSPYGELLSTPTITHSRFLSGADECLWDSETGLFYLHARYYDPQLGRFIQEDIVEGDLESPASQNRYTYCQNDPVSLVDPSGYSPQNTNTPTRFGQFNIANLDSPYGCSLSDLQPVLPELQPSSGGEVIGPEEMFVYDSCKKKSRMMGASGEEIDYDKEFKAMGGTVVENDDGSKTYEVEIDGEQIQITINKNGTKVSVTSKSNSPKGEIIAEEFQKGLNDALFSVNGKIDNLDDFMKRFCVFTHNNNQEWKLLVNKGYVSGSWYDYAYHAARGIVISDGMSKTGVNKYDQYDEEFGFWTSYIDKKEGYNMSFDLSKRKKSEELFQDSDVLTIYEYADIMKCIAFQESSFNTGD